jgi:predicted Ser/Thr protein kinase
MRSILLDAADDPSYSCLTPMAVLDRLRELLRDRSLYEFLQIEPRDGYHDCASFVEDVENVLVESVVVELQDAMELIREEEYDRRFERYFDHVLAFNKGELVRNETTGALEPADTATMEGVESLLSIQDPIDVFRKNLVAKIGAYAVDQPGEPVNFRELFPEILRALKNEFRKLRRDQILAIQGHLLLHGTDAFDSLAAGDRTLVERTLRNMEERYGYCAGCLKDVVAFVLRRV